MNYADPPSVYRQAGAPVEARVADLLARLTLEEKCDQLHQCGVGDANPNNLASRPDQLRATYGSFILNGARPDLALRNALQRRCVEDSRLGIPALFGADVIHGYRTIFPIPLAQACAWDAGLMRKACAAAATEARANGVDWTFAPMVDHGVDPRWGRIAETFGESSHAAATYAVAAVQGYQGGIPGSGGGVAACLKHFVGYGASEGGRDYASTAIPSQRLWEDHLPPFEAGVRAGAASVMSAFNDLNGIPASANREMLTAILRERWGFEGVVVSDWNAVEQLIRQGFAIDGAEAARRAVLAGVDLDMADGLYRRHLPELVRSGAVPGLVVDEAVRRVLRLKFRLGLFERPYVEASPLTDVAPMPAQRELAREFALRSMVLLKNEAATLPLAGEETIALIGPLAEETMALLGPWAQQGRGEETESIAAALRARVARGVEVERGCAIEGGDDSGFAAALALARRAEAVILCLGEHGGMSGENASYASIRLPGRQEELALAVGAVARRVVLILVTGRPVELLRIETQVGAILAAWQPGSAGGAAIADVLLGNESPSGRLAITWPRATGQIPVYHHERPRARPGAEGGYRDLGMAPQFEFGHGLGYTSWERGPLVLSAASVAPGGRLSAEIAVRNSGRRRAREVLLWFIEDPVGSITRPARELRHFEAAWVEPGETRVFRWEIEPARDLSFPDADGRRVVEPGEIRIRAAGLVVRFEVLPG